MLSLINIRLWQVFSEHNNVPFSDRSILMFDDFGQLLPILDLFIYAKVLWNSLSNTDLVVYNQFKEAYRLNIIQRQSGDTKKQ